MVAEKWFEAQTGKILVANITGDEKTARVTEDRVTSRMLAIRSIFCPACNNVADMRRMLWIEDNQGIVFRSIRCHFCVDAKPFKIHPAANEVWHGWNQIWTKRLNKAADPVEIAKKHREREEADAKETDRILKLQLEDSYYFLPDWTERLVDVVLAGPAPAYQRIGRFQGKATVQVPIARKTARAYAALHGHYVSIRDTSDTGALNETVSA